MRTNNSLPSKFYQPLFLIIVAISLLLVSCKIIEIDWQYDLGLNKATTHGKVCYSTDAVNWHELIPGEDTLVYSNVKFYFKAISDSGYALMDWNHPKIICGNNPTITQAVNITENITLFPTFEEVSNSYIVKASDEMAIANGKIRYSLDSNIWNDLDQRGTPPITYNQKIWLAAVPTAGYFWQQWTNDASGTKDSIQIIVNKNLIVGANFTNINPNKWKITINPIPTNGNKIQYTTGVPTNPYMDITTNPFELNEGTILFLKAIPNDGGITPYDFEKWTGDVSGTMAITDPINIDKDVTVSAIFNVRKYVLSLPTVAEGNITYSTDSATWKSAPSPADTVHILAGTKVFVRVQPIAGKLLKNIQVNSKNVSPDSLNLAQGTVTIMMNGDKRVEPIFNSVYTLTLKISAGETIKAYYKNTYATADEIPTSELTKIPAGTPVFIKVTPPVGKAIKNIKVNGTSVAFDTTQGTINFMMNSNKEVATDLITFYTLTLRPNNGETIKAYYKNSYVTADEIPTANLNRIFEGTTVYIKVTPPAGKLLESIKTNGVTSDGINIANGTATVTMNGDKTITATFKITYKLTLNSILATTNGKPIPNIEAFSDASYTTQIIDIEHIAPNTVVYLKTTPGRDPVLQTMKTFGANTDNFAPYQGIATVTMNSDKTVTATFEALSQFPFSKSNSNTVIKYNGSLSEIVFPAVSILGDAVLTVMGSGGTNPSGTMFANPANITSITLPNSLISIDNSAFSYTQNLSSITIPNTVTHIGEFVFYNNYTLGSIVLPNDLTYIGRYAFATCPFSQITIPAKVTEIREGNFDHSFIKDVYILNPIPFTLGAWLSGTNPTFSRTPKIHVPPGTIDAYKTAPGWKEHAALGQIVY